MTITEVDLYLDKDGDVVELGDSAAFLLVRAGKEIPRSYEAPANPEPQVEVEAEPEVEVVEKPVKRRKKPADKVRKTGGDK